MITTAVQYLKFDLSMRVWLGMFCVALVLHYERTLTEAIVLCSLCQLCDFKKKKQVPEYEQEKQRVGRKKQAEQIKNE